MAFPQHNSPKKERKKSEIITISFRTGGNKVWRFAQGFRMEIWLRVSPCCEERRVPVIITYHRMKRSFCGLVEISFATMPPCSSACFEFKFYEGLSRQAVVVQWSSMRAHNARAAGSNPSRVRSKITLPVIESKE